MRHCWWQSINKILCASVVSLLVAQSHADEPMCAAVKDAIRTGSLEDNDAISACAQVTDGKSLAELVAMAVEYRQRDISIRLLKANDKISIGPHLVHLAALFDQPAVLKLLLTQRPDLLEARDKSGRTPLTSAAIGRSFLSARILLGFGAHEEIGQSLMIAVGRSTEIAYLVMEERSAWLSNEKVAGDVLGAAIEYNYPPLLQFILDLGVSSNARDSEGYHVLLHAPQHKTEYAGEYNWGFMVQHGANELEAICSLSTSEMDHAEKLAPEWYARKVSLFRSKCPPSDGFLEHAPALHKQAAIDGLVRHVKRLVIRIAAL